MDKTIAIIIIAVGFLVLTYILGRSHNKPDDEMPS